VCIVKRIWSEIGSATIPVSMRKERAGWVLFAICACSGAVSTQNPNDGGTATDGGSSGDSGTASDGGSGPDGGPAGDAGTGTDAGPGSDAGGAVFLNTGCPLFAADYAYNQDVSALQPDPSSAGLISYLQSNAPAIAAEFPGGEFYNIVPASQPMVPVDAGAVYGFLPNGTFFLDNASELATATAPIPSAPVFECQGQSNCDHHFIILETGVCQLFELYSYNPTSPTTGWEIMVQWQLDGSPQIPGNLQIGSTTQAGTPLLPGVIWPAEVARGSIDHAIDIVMPDNGIAPCVYVHPASTVRYTGADAGAAYGTRFRLKASYDTSGYTGSQALVVIRALQKFGMIVTDGSGEARSVFRLGQDPDGGTLDQADITQLNRLSWSDFDVMPLGTVYRDCSG
jgi:hypothetical protein